MRTLLGLRLRGLGVEAGAAAGAVEALTEVAAGRADAVVSDYSMPGGTGLDLLRALRRRHGPVPFVLTSSLLPDGVRERALALGAHAVVDKARVVELLPELLAGFETPAVAA
jgi:CheY-like chemotaxis protein